MLIVFNDSPKHLSQKVRGIIGRYCWKIGRDLWVWDRVAVREEIIECLKEIDQSVRIVFVWKDSTSNLGFQVKVIGKLESRQTNDGLFNHSVRM